MDKIKAKLEQLYHRLQGHLLISVIDPHTGKTKSDWAKDVYHIPFSHIDLSESLLWVADMCNGNTWILYPSDDVTITGA